MALRVTKLWIGLSFLVVLPVLSFQQARLCSPRTFHDTSACLPLPPHIVQMSNSALFVKVTDASEVNYDLEELDQNQGRTGMADDIEQWRMEVKNALMRASNNEESAQIIETNLLKLVNQWKANPDPTTELTATDFLAAITAWSSSGSPETARRVGLLFFEQEELYNMGCASVKPNQEVVSAVLASMSSSRERGADRRVWAILERAEADYGIEASADMYASVIRSLARSRDWNSAERAESVLKDAVAKFPPGIDENGNSIGMTVDSFNVVLTAWAKSGRDDGPLRAEELLVYMDEVHREHGEDRNFLKPNVSSFTSLIDAYAQTNDWDGVSASERMFNRLLDQYLEGDETLEPNVASWTIVISAWTRLARKNFKRCAERADKLLRRMEELYSDGRISVAPDAITYKTVMNAWAASKSANGAQRAEEILDEMQERYLDGEDEMRPTMISIKIVIDAWMKTDDPNAMGRAEAILEKFEDMEEFQDPIDDEIVQEIYRSLLFGWTKQKDPRRAEEYLTTMVSLGLKPDSFCYERVIDSYIQLNERDLLERTYSVFELMERSRKDGDMNPNERVYTSFLRALTKARVVGLTSKTIAILKKMNELYEAGNKGMKPSVFTYNAILNACAESKWNEEERGMDAFKVAVGIFNDVRNGVEGPDHMTFGNMLRCAALLPEGEKRDAIVTSTFQLCCEQGFVNSYVIRDLQYACTEELWRSLLRCPNGDVDCERLPAAWRTRFGRNKQSRRSDKRRSQGRDASRRPSGRRRY